MMEIVGKFKGKDSMGFKNGKKYSLRAAIKPVTIYGKGKVTCLCVYDTYHSLWCPYESIQAFLNNWTVIHSNNEFKASLRLNMI